MERIKEAIERAKGIQDRTGYRPEPVKERSGQETPGAGLPRHTVPVDRGHLDSMRIVAFDASDSRSIPFDMLRTKVLQEMDTRGWQTLVVTSPSTACGKTVTAINLAFSIARQPDRHVVLLDLDLRKPSVASTLGFTPAKLLRDVLVNPTLLSEAITIPEIGGAQLGVLADGAPIPQAYDVIGSRGTLDVLGRLKQAEGRRIVIIDMPPMLVTDDVMAILPHIDCVLLLVAAGASTVEEIEACERLLDQSNLLGVVLNKSLTRSRHGYQ